MDQQTISDLVSTIRDSQSKGVGCSLLVGAGCSVKGGIPAAKGFVKLLKRNFPQAYEKAEVKTYQACMSQLEPAEQNKLFEKVLENSKVNWANICIALLMQKGFISRVLTTNFDDLLRRACAMMGEFPTIVDPTFSEQVKGLFNTEKMLFYLHGQSPEFGVSRIGTKSQAYWDSLAGIFKEVSSDRPLLVVGYNGGKDPVFEQLKKAGPFSNLYWVTHKENNPPAHVRETILSDGNNASYIPGYSADGFFIELAKQLEVFPPEILSRPFSHLEGIIKSLTNFPLPGQNDEVDVTNAARLQTQIAIHSWEAPKENANDSKNLKETIAKAKESPELLTAIVTAQNALITGDLEGVLDQTKQYEKTPSPQLGELLSWALILKGKTFISAVATANQEDIDGLYKKAEEKFEAALKISPNMHQAVYQWGSSLLERAKRAEGDAIEELLALAGDKFQKTIHLKPKMSDALFGWGYVLCERGKTKKADKASPFFAQAVEKFQSALESRPDLYEAHFGSGCAMMEDANLKEGPEALESLNKAQESFNRALDIHPEYCDAIYRIGKVNLALAQKGPEDKADALLNQAENHFKKVLKINPNREDANLGLGSILFERAKTLPQKEAVSLFQQAAERFEKSAGSNEKNPEFLCNWGLALKSQSEAKTGKEAMDLLTQASEKFQTAVTLKPDYYEAINQLGSALMLLALSKEGFEATTQLAEAVEYFKASLALKPENYEAQLQWGNAMLHLAKDKPSNEAMPLLMQAEEKFKAAVGINPNGHEALNHLGNLLMQQSKNSSPPQSENLFKEAVENYKKALAIKPDYPEALLHWGSSLFKLAQGKEGEEAEEMFAQAAEKMEAALKIQSENHEVLITWGLVLMEQAKTKKGINAHPLLVDAKKKFQSAEDLKPGSGAYHMARLMALLANESGCREWLERCRELGVLPNQDHLQKDPGLVSIRDSKWFKLLLYEEFMEKKEEKTEAEAS